MSKANLKPTKISQLYQGEHIKNSKGNNIKSPGVCRDGNAEPSYHPWESGTLNNFLSGKQIQCGRKSTYHCNLKTVRWIKGYRNTCPLAGCCGTFNKPAPLVLSDFNFLQKKIAKKIKISNVKISYKHHVTGVDVGAGKNSETKSWAGYFPYVDIILYKNNTKIDTIRHNKRVPLAHDSTVTASFTKLIAEFSPQKDNIRIEIAYAANGDGKYYTEATNPSIIYAAGLNVDIEYEYLEQPKIAIQPVGTISGDSETNTIITDPRKSNMNAGEQNCRTTFTHIIKFAHTQASDIVVSVPNGVKYTKTVSSNQVQYTYQDISGKAGEKTITYSLKSNSKAKIIKKYTAKLYTKPTFNIATQYIKNQKYNPQDTFITITNKCWNNIKIYADGNQNLLVSWNNTIPNSAMPNTINQEELLNKINELSCGYHTLHFYIDDVFQKQITIQIKSPQISFESSLRGEYRQDKEDCYVPIDITRTDSSSLNQPIDVTIINTADNIAPQTISFEPLDTHTCQINIAKPGTFDLKYQYNDGCKMITRSLGKYIVTPSHIQSYDTLIIRGEDVAIDYDSIVIREGDNQKKPVTYTDANLRQSMSDITLFGKDGYCALGELGFGILAVKNNTQQTIHNLCIELNPLISSADEYEDFNPLIMEWKTGMLQNFDKNFSILNPELQNLVEILNTTHHDFINEGTENVILCIKEIKPGSNNRLELKIPYSSSYAREIYMNFLLFGEPTDFIDLDNNVFEDKESFYQQSEYGEELFASHTSKQDRGCLCISLRAIDMLSADLFIDGDDLDRNDVTNTDDLDIRYGIQLSNADCDRNLSSATIQTEIKNDVSLIPTAYQFGDEKTNIDMTVIYDNNNNVVKRIYKDNNIDVYWGIDNTIMNLIGEEVYLRYLDVNNNIQYMRAITDKDGLATFKFLIPDYYQGSEYHLTDILNNVDILYQGNNLYKESKLNGYEIVNQIPSTKIDVWGFIYYTLNQEPVFVDIDSIQYADMSNIYNIFVVGQLINKENNTGINDKIISYNIDYDTSFCQQGITTTNKSDVYGENRKNADGFFKIKINKPQSTQNTPYNLREVYNNMLVSYEGDLSYQKCNHANITIDDGKSQSKLKYLHDYNIYRKDETINITVHLSAYKDYFRNTIKINHQLINCGQTFHIFYQTCSSENEKGFKTIFKTASENIIPNQIEEIIYCNVKTDLKILAKLQKKVVENHNINVLTINAINGYKPNKNVIVKALIGPDAEKQKLGDYLALSAIDIDKEKYSYDRSSDIIYWKIGDMDSYETQICNILLEGENIGHNTIYVCGFDYLNLDTEKIIPTTLSIEDSNDNDTYYVGDNIILKAKLTNTETQQNLFGQIYFDIQHHQNYQEGQDLSEYLKALECVLNNNSSDFNTDYENKIIELLNKQDIFTRLTDEERNIIEEEYQNISKNITKAQAQVAIIDDEYYALAHLKLTDTATTTVRAFYEGAQMLSTQYEPSKSNILVYDNIQKYDTVLTLQCNQDEIFTNQNIQIIGTILYDEQTKTYFDSNLNIKFIINNQELKNIKYMNNSYVASFAITQPGEYTIQGFIPETNKTEESFAQKTINVREDENND